MRYAAAALGLIMASAGCGKSGGGSASSSSSAPTPPAARRIEGGTAINVKGVTFDIPRAWQSRQEGGVILMGPQDANPSGVLEEAYLVAADPAVRTLESPDFQRSVETAVGQIQQGARLKRGAVAQKFGELDGRAWVYTAATQDGREAEIRAYGFMGTCGCAIIALGFPEVLARRDGDLKAILGSMTKAAASPSPSGGGGVRGELAGTWAWITNFNANNGGGRQTDTTLVLNADGTYQYRYEHVNTNPFGASWGSQNDAGRWSATDDSITFTSQDGEQRTCTIEKRNHPKNTNDPMIILDGKAFVTAYQKDPW